MITKNKSQKIMQLKYLLVIPLLAGMLILSSFEDNNKSKIQDLPVIEQTWESNEKTENKTTEYLKIEKNNKIFKSKDTIIETLEIETLDVPFAIIDNVPVFPGCEGTEEELRQCLQENITKHVNKKFNSQLANNLGLSPGIKHIFVMFKIDKEGNITGAQARAPHKSLADEAIRVINNLPKMEPGKQKGKNVGVKYSLPIAFKVEGKKQKEEIITGKEIVLGSENKLETEKLDEFPFAIIDESPIFPGCNGDESKKRDCLVENITKHVNVNFNSQLASNLGLQPGVKRIFVVFKIDKEGNIDEIRARAPHKMLEEEAIRVVKMLPKMIPGKQKGIPVGVKYSLPIAFKVAGNEKNVVPLKGAKEKFVNRISSNSIPLNETVLNDAKFNYPKLEENASFYDCKDLTNYDEIVKCFSNKIASHVAHNYNYKLAKDLNIESGYQRVFVIFTIRANGKVDNIQTRANYQELADEAKRVLKSLPNLNTGVQNSKDLTYSLPLTLRVE